jgi:RNA methyltransferase, TrmH family
MIFDSVQEISSRQNPLLKQLLKMGGDHIGYRKTHKVWLEGEHLCEAALRKGVVPEVVIFSKLNPNLPQLIKQFSAIKKVVIDDRLFADISGLGSPAKIGMLVITPFAAEIDVAVPTVVLDRVQDAGNVGSILRSAAAFGFRQILAVKGTAALWSQKVIRAGMGAHFSLSLHEQLTPVEVASLALPLVATSSYHGGLLHEIELPPVTAWVFGHEGQGVSETIARMAKFHARIAQPGGEESLNVAAAAAICLHQSAAIKSVIS